MRTDQVDLGKDGGRLLKAFLTAAAAQKGISLSALVEGAYRTIGHKIGKPYDTVKQWFMRPRPRVDVRLLEAVLGAAGCRKLADYPNLPDLERRRLETREVGGDTTGALEGVHRFIRHCRPVL